MHLVTFHQCPRDDVCVKVNNIFLLVPLSPVVVVGFKSHWVLPMCVLHCDLRSFLLLLSITNLSLYNKFVVNNSDNVKHLMEIYLIIDC